MRPRIRPRHNAGLGAALLAGVTFGVTGTGCASGVGSAPPGGREDHEAPGIVRITPDTGTVNARQREMRIDFNEVISERPQTQATTLADLVMISPRDGQPNVDWHRDHITIRPRKGWRANTAYTVTILPGISDLRNNVRNKTVEVLFSTGPTIPVTSIGGRVFDGVSGTPSRGALVQAIAHADTSLVYVGMTDSTGAFLLRGMQPGAYSVTGFIDEDRNRGRGTREPFDSTAFTLSDSAHVEFLAYVHDSAGPRLGSVTVRDSVTLQFSFDTPVAPTPSLTVAQLRLIGADSVLVPITAITPDTGRAAVSGAPTPGVLPPGVIPRPGGRQPVLPESRRRRGGRLPAPSPTPARDTTRPEIRPTRPLLVRQFVVTLGTPLHPKTQYVLRATNVRAPNGPVLTSERVFTTPAPPPPPAPSDTSAQRRAVPGARPMPAPRRNR